MSTFHISGTLAKENFDIQIGDDDERHFQYFVVSQEIDAATAKVARDHFEIGGWEWEMEPEVKLITESMKMERAGQPMLFELPEKATE